MLTSARVCLLVLGVAAVGAAVHCAGSEPASAWPDPYDPAYLRADASGPPRLGRRLDPGVTRARAAPAPAPEPEPADDVPDAAAPVDAATDGEREASDAATEGGTPDAGSTDGSAPTLSRDDRIRALCGRVCERGLVCTMEAMREMRGPGGSLDDMRERMGGALEECRQECVEKATDKASDQDIADAEACHAKSDCKAFMECMKDVTDRFM